MGQIDEAYVEPKPQKMYDMLVKEEGSDTWTEKDQTVPERWKGTPEEHAKAVIDNYNTRLEEGDPKRQLVGITNVRQEILTTQDEEE